MEKALNAPVETTGGIKLFGTSPLSQIVTGFAIIALLYLGLSASEYIYKSFTRMWKERIELFPNTYASGSRVFTALQNPNNPLAKTITVSDNQRSGVEFSYAMFINLSSATFKDGNQQLYHILHKGYSKPYPLLGPGVFACGDRNAIRIFMNCYDTWDNYTDIENIPVDIWFHLVVSCKGNNMYIYINGNLKSKIALSANTPPYQNYGDVYLFNQRKMTITSTNVQSLAKDTSDPDTIVSGASPTQTYTMTFNGAATGMVSRVYYFSYALTYTEIQSLINMGISTIMDGLDMSISPYLSDTWWTRNQAPPTH